MTSFTQATSPHLILYKDLYYERGCKVNRCIIFHLIEFTGTNSDHIYIWCDNAHPYKNKEEHTFRIEPFQKVSNFGTHEQLRTDRHGRRLATAWNFLFIVRPPDNYGVGLEFNGERTWDTFWTNEDRIDASPSRSAAAISIPLDAVTVSPDGCRLAFIYSRDDSDMREEPELSVYDLQPMVRALLWAARRDFVMVLFGHGFLPMQGTASKETGATTLAYQVQEEEAGTQSTETVAAGAAERGDAVAPHCVCRVFCNLALVKCIVQYVV